MSFVTPGATSDHEASCFTNCFGFCVSSQRHSSQVFAAKSLPPEDWRAKQNMSSSNTRNE